MVALISEDGFGASITATSGSPPTLAVRGEIDIAVTEWFDGELAQHIASAPDELVLDLSGVTFIDSSGLAVLVSTSRRVSLRISEASDVVRRAIETTGLAEALQLAP